jgi:hypothetical protein
MLSKKLALWLLLAGKADRGPRNQSMQGFFWHRMSTWIWFSLFITHAPLVPGRPDTRRCASEDSARFARERGSEAAEPQIFAPILLTGACVFVPAAVLAVAGADEAAEDDGEAATGDAGEIGASENAKTVVLFPDFPDKSTFPALPSTVASGHGRLTACCAGVKTRDRVVFSLICCLQRAEFTQGQIVDVLCGFSNTGGKSFNITSLKGSLNSPMGYQYIQNFTESTPFAEIKEGAQDTLYYRFYPDPNLEPNEYVLTLTVDYVDADKEEFQTVYFNQTVELVESQSSADSRTLFGRVLMLVLIAAAGFGASQLAKRFGGKKSKARSTSAPKASSAGSDEWLQDTMLAKSGSGKKRA